VSEDLTKSITIKMALADINAALVRDLELAFDEHQGQHEVTMLVEDKEKDLLMSFTAEKKRVQIDSFFVQRLEKLNIPYKLN